MKIRHEAELESSSLAPAGGLAATWSLGGGAVDSNGHDVRVFEAMERIGGRMFSETIDGFHVYGGASVIHRSFATTRKLAAELNVELFESPKKRGGQSYAGDRFWRRYVGGTLKQTLQTMRTMLFSPQHSLAGNLEFFRLFSMLRKRADDLDFEAHSRMLDLDSNTSFADFARDNSLTRYLQQAGELDLNCFTAASAEEVGAAYGLAVLWLWSIDPATRNYLPREGLPAFTSALAQACEKQVEVSTPIERIILEEGKATGVVTASGETVAADAVICATTASTAARIIPDLPDDLRAALERVSYSSCCYVAFGLDKNILEEGSHAALFPPGSPTFLTMLTNLAATTPSAAPPDKSLVHALVIGEKAKALFMSDDHEIARRVHDEMLRFFPSMPETLFAKVYRWPEAFCLAPGGMLKDMHAMRSRLGEHIQGLFLAGDYTRLPSLNGALRSGLAASESSMSYLG